MNLSLQDALTVAAKRLSKTLEQAERLLKAQADLAEYDKLRRGIR